MLFPKPLAPPALSRAYLRHRRSASAERVSSSPSQLVLRPSKIGERLGERFDRRTRFAPQESRQLQLRLPIVDSQQRHPDQRREGNRRQARRSRRSASQSRSGPAAAGHGSIAPRRCAGRSSTTHISTRIARLVPREYSTRKSAATTSIAQSYHTEWVLIRSIATTVAATPSR